MQASAGSSRAVNDTLSPIGQSREALHHKANSLADREITIARRLSKVVG